MGVRNRVETFPGDAFAQYYTKGVQILYYYDYVLTLPDEVKYAWTGRKTWSESVAHLVLSVLTEPVFWVFIFVNWARSDPKFVLTHFAE